MSRWPFRILFSIQHVFGFNIYSWSRKLGPIDHSALIQRKYLLGAHISCGTSSILEATILRSLGSILHAPGNALQRHYKSVIVSNITDNSPAFSTAFSGPQQVSAIMELCDEECTPHRTSNALSVSTSWRHHDIGWILSMIAVRGWFKVHITLHIVYQFLLCWICTGSMTQMCTFYYCSAPRMCG